MTKHEAISTTLHPKIIKDRVLVGINQKRIVEEDDKMYTLADMKRPRRRLLPGVYLIGELLFVPIRSYKCHT
jgi:hypothetical protein